MSDADLTPYLDLIPNQNRNQPNFVATLSLLIQALANNIETQAALPADFDIDTAVGAQLDVVGEWVGRSRYLSLPLTNVYFSFSDATLGFGQGTWKGPFDPVTGLVALPDDAYRTLLRATIAANQWDGTIPQAYEVWDTLFAGTGFRILIQDNEDMTMLFGLLGTLPDAVTLALLTGGYLALKPAGVRIAGYVTGPAPLFGFGVQNASIAGFGTGSWAEFLDPS